MNLWKILPSRAELHHMLWTWLSENPEDCSSDWPYIEIFYTLDPNSYMDACFACGEARQRIEDKYSNLKDRKMNLKNTCAICDFCPIDWEITSKCTDYNSYYTQRKSSFNNNLRSKLALKISTLTWE